MKYGGISLRRVDDDESRHVTISGELDVSNVEELRSALEGCQDRERLVVDTTELSFIDSSGLAELVRAREELGPHRFRLIPGPATVRVLALTKLHGLFDLELQCHEFE